MYHPTNAYEIHYPQQQQEVAHMVDMSLLHRRPSSEGEMRNNDNDNNNENNEMTPQLAVPTGSEGEEEDANGRPRKKYHRHTQHQIKEMEAFFKENPHPDDRQRKELANELGLDPLQIKFWFQNKRTQLKSQTERYANNLLRDENEKLRVENNRYKEAMSNSSCPNCGGPSSLGEMSLDEQQLRIENVRLRQQVERLSGMVGDKTASSSQINPTVDGNNNGSSAQSVGMVGEMYANGSGSDVVGPLPNTCHSDKPIIAELAAAAMDELIRLALAEYPVWVPSPGNNGPEILNQVEYLRLFPRDPTPQSLGFRSEATRESAVVVLNHISLIEILMDVKKWSSVFCGIVSRAVTPEVLSTGVAGNYSGAMQVMSAEFQMPTPLVPTRENYFVRYCKQFPDNASWIVVDVSLDNLRPSTTSRSRRCPSGCLIQQLPNGYSKVTWIEHVQVEDRAVHDIYNVLVNSGLAFGARRWVASLDRQCERLATTMAIDIPAEDPCVITNHDEGIKTIQRVAERMIKIFCNMVGASTAHAWIPLSADGGDDVRVMSRNSIDDPSIPPGIVLCAATSFWLPVPPNDVFNFLRNIHTRIVWDILSNGGEVVEIEHVPNGRDPGNSISIFRVTNNELDEMSQSKTVILQESCTDPSGSYVVYAPVDISAMELVLSGGDPDDLALLPSGFAILPDGPGPNGLGPITDVGSGGSLVSVAFQILVNSAPTEPLSANSVTTVNILLQQTIERIKAAVMHNGA